MEYIIIKGVSTYEDSSDKKSQIHIGAAQSHIWHKKGRTIKNGWISTRFFILSFC